MSLGDQKGSAEYPYSKKTVFDAIMAASHSIDGLELDGADEMSGRITLHASVSWSSWGEIIPIQLTTITPIRTKVEIISSPKIGGIGSLNDFGKNRRNIEKVLNAISIQLSNLPAEESYSTDLSMGSTADELFKLKQLKEDGILSEDEFKEQKALILKRSAHPTPSHSLPKANTSVSQSSSNPLVHIEGGKGDLDKGLVFLGVLIVLFFILVLSLIN